MQKSRHKEVTDDRDKAILFNFRRCPYAIRARMALVAAKIEFELFDIKLSQKPQCFLDISPKGTVPVLVLSKRQGSKIIDESLDILNWALGQHDPYQWLAGDDCKQKQQLVEIIDRHFKKYLDRYKYPNRFVKDDVSSKELSQDSLRRALQYLEIFEERLSAHTFLFGPKACWVDVATFAFIRQFHHVDKSCLSQYGFEKTKKWLETILAWPLTIEVLKKY